MGFRDYGLGGAHLRAYWASCITKIQGLKGVWGLGVEAF